MIFAEEDLNSLNAIAGLLASFGCDSQAGCVLYIQHKIARPLRPTKGNAEMRNMSKKTWKLRVWNRMTEIQKLDYLLTKAGITHEMERRFPENDKNRPEVCGPGALHDGGYQITVRDKSGAYLWDAVCGWCTYGFPHLIEVFGLALVDHYDVEGWLTARQVMKMWRCRNAAQNR